MSPLNILVGIASFPYWYHFTHPAAMARCYPFILTLTPLTVMTITRFRTSITFTNTARPPPRFKVPQNRSNPYKSAAPAARPLQY